MVKTLPQEGGRSQARPLELKKGYGVKVAEYLPINERTRMFSRASGGRVQEKAESNRIFELYTE